MKTYLKKLFHFHHCESVETFIPAYVTSIFSFLCLFLQPCAALQLRLLPLNGCRYLNMHPHTHTQTHTNPVHMCVNELISLRFPPLVYIFSLLASRSCRI